MRFVIIIVIIVVFLLGLAIGWVVGYEDLFNKVEEKSLLTEEICCLKDIKEKPNTCVPAKCYKYINN